MALELLLTLFANSQQGLKELLFVMTFFIQIFGVRIKQRVYVPPTAPHVDKRMPIEYGEDYDDDDDDFTEVVSVSPLKSIDAIGRLPPLEHAPVGVETV